MDEINARMVNSDAPPDISEVKAWLGKRAGAFWDRLTKMIERKYPGVFAPEWLYGGRKHGWSLRYKKSKSFCTLIPEKGCLKILIVFGAKERAGVETIKNTLSASIRKLYDKATTYHDGKWVVLTVDTDKILDDIEVLLTVKRKPKGQ